LLSKYCSPARPTIRRATNSAGMIIDELIHDNVGTSSATTCLVGELRRGWYSAYPERGNHDLAYLTHARTPCEVLLFDVFFHRDMIADTNPKLAIFGDLEFESEPNDTKHRTRHRLMPWKKLETLGWGITGAY